MRAVDYAKAMFELGGNAERLKRLRGLLQARGQEKLLPNIYREYEKLERAAMRRARLDAAGPETERRRILVELYRKLVSVPTPRL